MRSRITASKLSLAAMNSPSRPLSACSTTCPASRRPRTTKPATSLSSSTTRIRIASPPFRSGVSRMIRADGARLSPAAPLSVPVAAHRQAHGAAGRHCGDRADQPARAIDPLAIQSQPPRRPGASPARMAGPFGSTAGDRHARRPGPRPRRRASRARWCRGREAGRRCGGRSRTGWRSRCRPSRRRARRWRWTTPITSPSISNTGPPELPGLIGASSCRKLSNGPEPRSRPSAETMPAVTEPPRPNGLPAARIQSPTSTLCESPQVTCGRPRGVHLDHRDVGQRRRGRCTLAGKLAAVGQGHHDLLGVADDVVVGDDDAGRVDDEARAGAQHLLAPVAEAAAELPAERRVPQFRRKFARRRRCRMTVSVTAMFTTAGSTFLTSGAKLAGMSRAAATWGAVVQDATTRASARVTARSAQPCWACLVQAVIGYMGLGISRRCWVKWRGRSEAARFLPLSQAAASGRMVAAGVISIRRRQMKARCVPGLVAPPPSGQTRRHANPQPADL